MYNNITYRDSNDSDLLFIITKVDLKIKDLLKNSRSSFFKKSALKIKYLFEATPA